MTAAPARRMLAATLVALTAGLAGCGGEDAPRKSGPVAAYDAALHERLPEDVRRRGVITVAVDASYAPVVSFAGDGQTIVGFDPDLGKALGRVLGVDVQFVDSDFAGLLDKLRAGHFDAVMGGLTDTPEREREADFVSYFTAGSSIVVRRGNANGITDLVGLCGQTVAVEEGTTQVGLLERSQRQCRGSRIDVREFDTNADALLQLRTGRAEAVLNDYPPAAALANDAKTRGQYQLASTTQYEPGPYGIAVAKDDPELRDALQGAMTVLIRTGVYAEVLDRWNVADGAVPTAAINAAGGGTHAPGQD